MDDILLHICCGPCSLFCIDDLRAAFPERNIHGLFANPNIHPYDEFLRRTESTRQACEYKGIEVDFLPDFDQDKWADFTRSDGLPQKQRKPDPERCAMCYDVRMELTAGYASEHGFKAFTSTLFVSPYQDHELLRKVCEKKALKYGLEFVYRDFRVGFRQGQQEAIEIGLYRQKYCGCIRSKKLEGESVK